MQNNYGEDGPMKGNDKNDAYSKALESLEAFYEAKIQIIEKRLSDLESRFETCAPSSENGVFEEEHPIVQLRERDVIDQDPINSMPYEKIHEDESYDVANRENSEKDATFELDNSEENPDFKYHLLNIIKEKPMTSGELRDHANISLNLVTKYLRELQMEKKIKIQKEGHTIRYVPIL